MDTVFRGVWSLFLASAVLWLLAASIAHAQAPDFTLNRLDEAHLDSLAMRTANKIHEVKLEEEPKVLVVDFFRNSTGESSQLGTLLADRFSESLTAYSSGIPILDRRALKDYLFENWTTLDDFKSNEICLAVARQLGATGAIVGTLTEKNGNVNLTLRLEGFGPVERQDDIFALRDRTVVFPLTEELRSALYHPGPNYSRSADNLPEQIGIFRAGVNGVTQPQCIDCPNPDYSDAARAVKFQGTVVLSVLVTAEGQVTDIYVLRGAPFGLTAHAIKAARHWRMEPAQKDSKPVAARVDVELTFRLN